MYCTYMYTLIQNTFRLFNNIVLSILKLLDRQIDWRKDRQTSKQEDKQFGKETEKTNNKRPETEGI